MCWVGYSADLRAMFDDVLQYKYCTTSSHIVKHGLHVWCWPARCGCSVSCCRGSSRSRRTPPRSGRPAWRRWRGVMPSHTERVSTEISPGDGAVTSRRWENNYLQQIFNYNTTHHHQATEDSKNFFSWCCSYFVFSTTNTLNPHYFNVRTLSRRDPVCRRSEEKQKKW